MQRSSTADLLGIIQRFSMSSELLQDCRVVTHCRVITPHACRVVFLPSCRVVARCRCCTLSSYYNTPPIKVKILRNCLLPSACRVITRRSSYYKCPLLYCITDSTRKNPLVANKQIELFRSSFFYHISKLTSSPSVLFQKRTLR